MLTSDDPEVKRMSGTTPGTGKSLHLDEKWAYNAVRQVGNYGEIFDHRIIETEASGSEFPGI